MALEPVVTYRARSPERFINVSLLNNAFELCVVCPNAREEIGLKLKSHRELVGTLFTCTSSGGIYLAHCSKQVLNVMAYFVGDHIGLGKISRRLKSLF